LVEGLNKFLWVGQNGDRVRLEVGAGSMAGFELATEDEGREGELLFWQTELGAKLKKVRPEYYENDDEEKQELSGPNAFRPVFEWSLRRGLGISFAGVEGPRRRWHC
jgi:hypothetical protein